MTEPATERSNAKKALRRVLAPLVARVDAVRDELVETRRRVDDATARLDQLSRQVERLEAYQQVSRDEVSAAFASLTTALTDADPDMSPGEILQRRLDHALLHAEALDARTSERIDRELADLRSTLRLTQALAERGAPPPAAPAEDDVPAAANPAERRQVDLTSRFQHPTPSFDLLYRAFEDRHRGDAPSIRERQREDYLDLLSQLPNHELPIADLGCGRGELVRVLTEAGHEVLGVDSNLGQVIDGDDGPFEQADLFDWLDRREDASLRAVVAMHVVEHLPLDLQIRLVFEARRVLAEGGVLVLETPNTLSLSTAATNFWVDPTHERPVHPLFLEFLAEEAGFVAVESRPLHPLPIGFRGGDEVPDLVADLDSLIFGAGDLALVARR